jgi:predicted nuclease of predicted toxin-antitoxin system
MGLKKVKFLLDENIPIKLKQVFIDRGIQCTTIKDEGWLGIKNGELSNKLLQGNIILVTRDKDFTFFWKKHKIQVIYLTIEPANLKSIQPSVIELLTDWKYDLSRPFLLIVQIDMIRFWQEK